MEMRDLGSTGLRVSAIGLGTVKLGRTAGLKHPRPFEIPDDDAARALLARAQDLGINLIDTAPAYGVSEERLGALLTGQRDRWVVCTKAGEEFDGERSRFDFTPRAIRASVERSLRRLRTDALDCVLLHSDGDDAHVVRDSGAMGALERLRDEGKVRAVGASTKTPEGAAMAVERSDVVMLACNPRETGDDAAIESARARGVGVLVKKALMSGRLGDGDGGAEPATTDPVEAALRFVFARRGVSSVVVGTINPEHLSDNVAAAERALRAH
ncbi:MAG: aldo/keto reductase [Phycisphaerales bacterium]|nr:MAG: aldo/keto reductase [Phycisphaerales bacterium]